MRTWFRVGFALHLALVVLISVGAYTGHLPTSLPDVPDLDKLGHAILIGGLAFFLDGALDHRTLVRGRDFPRLAPVLVLVAAGVEEYLQRLSPRRTSDIADFAADVVGVCLFTWLARRITLHFARGSDRVASAASRLRTWRGASIFRFSAGGPSRRRRAGDRSM